MKAFLVYKFMINLFLVRHGETIWNKKAICQGRIDLELDETGISEAKEVARLLKENNYKFDLFVSSPLKRAVKTCEILKEELDNKKEILKIDEFIERDFGSFEGQDNSCFRNAYINNDLEKYYSTGLESEEVLIKRIVKGINYLISNFDNKNIIVVTHSNVIRGFLVYIDKNKYNFLTKMPNLAISEYKINSINDIEIKSLSIFENHYEDKTTE